MLKPEDRITVIKSHIERAEERIREAKELTSGHPGFSARASYDAVYFSAIAMLVGYSLKVPKTHEGVNNALKNNFVMGEKIFPPHIAGYLAELETDRNTHQYNVITKITKDQSLLDVKKAEAFFEAARNIVKNRLEYLESHIKDIPAPDLEDKVLALNFLPDPDIYSTPSNLVNYRGPILHADNEEGFSVQQTGKNTLVIHKHAALSRIPEKGENLQINYKPGGKAEIKALRDGNKNTVTGRR